MAKGKAAAKDKVDSNKVSGKPPHKSVSTGVNPNKPPRIKLKHTSKLISHASAKPLCQYCRIQLSTSSTTIKIVASKGRHCSAFG